MTARISALLSIVAAIACGGGAPVEIRDHRALAAYWSPVIVQHLDDRFAENFLSRFDADQDWQADNNWEHAEDHDLAGSIYYWVVETQTHHFVGYAFYYLGGRPTRDAELSENDLQGIVLVIEKASDPEAPHGRFQAILIRTSEGFLSFAERQRHADSAWQANAGRSLELQTSGRPLDGDVDFVVDAFGFHPVVYVEAHTHSIQAQLGPQSAERQRYRKTPDLFEREGVTDWRQLAATAPRKGPNNSPLVTRRGRRGVWADGVTYRFEGKPVAVLAAGKRSRGRTPHHWQLVGYELRSLEELWSRRDDPITFASVGRLGGDGPRGAGSLAPWAWSGGEDGSAVSEFFENPARLVTGSFDGIGNLSTEVVGRSFALGRPGDTR